MTNTITFKRHLILIVTRLMDIDLVLDELISTFAGAPNQDFTKPMEFDLHHACTEYVVERLITSMLRIDLFLRM